MKRRDALKVMAAAVLSPLAFKLPAERWPLRLRDGSGNVYRARITDSVTIQLHPGDRAGWIGGALDIS